MKQRSRSIVLATLAVSAVALIVLSIWYPVWSHYRTQVKAIPDDVIERSRQEPSDDVLLELSTVKHHLIPPMGRLVTDPVAESDAILAAAMNDDGIDFKGSAFFDAERLSVVDYSSFLVPKTLLEAYRQSNDEKYFNAARRFIFEFADYESHAWLPKAFLWQDHSVAVRSSTLAEFWRLFRHHPDYNEADARVVLRLAMVSAKQLADDKKFTFNSNHGTQQNLGLMHFVLAFPELPDMSEYKNHVIKRHDEHIDLMINSEGVVLEHSMGYHRFGVELLAVALRYMTMLGEPIPRKWLDKYHQSNAFYRQFKGPDGSIPSVGDSSDAARSIGPMSAVLQNDQVMALARDTSWQMPRAQMIYPAAGYAIQWSGSEERRQDLSRTIFTWSYYPGFPHKHADETSINIWTPDGRWWTNVGYWPYFRSDRHKALGWTGSNAPHLVDEPKTSARYSWLRAYVAGDQATFVEVQRESSAGFSVRRQLLQLPPDVWVIVDWFEEKNTAPIRTVWGLDHDLTISADTTAHAYSITGGQRLKRMRTHLLFEPAAKVAVVKGLKDPLVGWVEVDYAIEEAPALLLEQPAKASWAANISVLSEDGARTLDTSARMVAATGAENWKMQLHINQIPLTIERRDTQLETRRGNQLNTQVINTSYDRRPLEKTNAQARYDKARKYYASGYSDLLKYRWQWTWLLVGAWLVQEILFWLWRRTINIHTITLRIISLTGWLALGVWLNQVYLV